MLEAPPATVERATPAPTVHANEIGVAFTTLALADIAESPHNPRKHFDPIALEELTASIREQGIWEPLLVRPHPSAHGVYELASGHRRYRAAKAAGLTDVPALIRDLDDATFIEVLTVANLQREDVHPLEEADGYAEMMKSLGWDVPTIAKKVGKGETYVYDRLKFHVLIPAVRDLFFANRITAAHATELSRLKPAQQERALEPGREGGLWQSEGAWGEDAFDFELTGEDPYAGMKVRTVRELRAWVQTHTRFDAAAADPVLFPTVAAVQAAVEQKLKVVEITRSHAGSIRPEVKGEGEGRILSPVSWKRADGQPEDGEPTERCEYSERVLGVVVEGAGQGESFAICTAREKCKRHWATEMREKARRAKERESSGGASTNGNGSRPAAAKESLEQIKARRLANLYEAHEAAITEAIVDGIASASVTAVGRAMPDLLGELVGAISEQDQKAIARIKGTDAAAVVRRAYAAVLIADYDALSAWGIQHRLPETLGAIGLQLDKVLAKVLPIMCVHCGCTETDPCLHTEGEACAWISKKPPVCSAPACVAAEKKAAKKAGKKKGAR